MGRDRLLIELIVAHHHLATPRLVAKAGLNSDQWLRMLRDDEWVSIVPKVWRHAATPLTWKMQVRAGSMWLGRDAALYGVAGLRWNRVEVPEIDRAEFLVPRHRRFVPPWMTLHTTLAWSLGDTVLVDGVRTCNATRAIIDMARTQSARQLEVAIDSAVRLRKTSVPSLSRRMSELEGSGRAGIRMLRTLLLDSGGESILERRMLKLLRVAGFPRPTPQVVHRGSSGRVIRVDFEFDFEDANLVVEVSGRKGHISDRDRQRDARRRNDLIAMGKDYVEFTTADVLDDPEYVLRTLRTHLPDMVLPRVPR